MTEISYTVEQLDRENGKIVVRGKITEVRVTSNLLRQLGGAYTGDTIEASMTYEPQLLPCDFFINEGLPLVREVVTQLAQGIDAVVRATMTEHAEALQEELTKGVTAKKKSPATEVF